MSISIRKLFLVVLAVVLGSLAVYAFTLRSYGAVTVDIPSTVNAYRTYDFFASTTAQSGVVSSTVLATTTSATSTNITNFYRATTGDLIDGSFNIAGAKKVTFYFTRGDTSGQGNAGLSIFRVQATRDGSNWVDVSRLLGVDVSASATSSVTINAATSTFTGALDIKDQAFKSVRCLVVETTDGEHSCAASAQY